MNRENLRCKEKETLKRKKKKLSKKEKKVRIKGVHEESKEEDL